MGRKTVMVLAMVLPMALGGLATAELQKGEIAPSANWVAYANVEAFRNSDLGRLVMSQLVTEEMEQKLQSFATIFSFHPLKDIRDITLYGQGQDRDNAVAIVEGQFSQNQLLALIRLSAQFQEMPYKGATLYRWLHKDEKKPNDAGQLMYGCFCGQNQVMISSGLQTLKQGVDVIKGESGAPTTLLQEIPEAQGTPFIQIVATKVSQMAGQEPKAAVLKQAQSLGLVAGEFGEKVFAELQIEGESAEVADSMAKMIQGVIALAQLSGQEQPQLSELARNVTVSQMDSTTQVHLSVPAQTVLDFLKQQWKQNMQQQMPTP